MLTNANAIANAQCERSLRSHSHCALAIPLALAMQKWQVFAKDFLSGITRFHSHLAIALVDITKNGLVYLVYTQIMLTPSISDITREWHTYPLSFAKNL